jgi:hypothetical protein
VVAALRRRVRVDVLAGLGFGADDMGALLAQRGWVLSDYLAGVNVELPLPQRGRTTDVFDERDHRPALYARRARRRPPGAVALHLGYFDNLADQDPSGGWSTRFGTVGAVVPSGRARDGHRAVSGGRDGDQGERLRQRLPGGLRAPLAGLAAAPLHGALRLLRVDDHDGAPITREEGHALTFAYLVEVGLRHRFAIEYLRVTRPPAATGFDDPSDGGGSSATGFVTRLLVQGTRALRNGGHWAGGGSIRSEPTRRNVPSRCDSSGP